jgi:hypothetical protein
MSQSPLRIAPQQQLIDDLADAVLSTRLDLDEMRSTTIAMTQRNLAWVAEVGDQIALMLMTVAPLTQPGGAGSPSRPGLPSRQQASRSSGAPSAAPSSPPSSRQGPRGVLPGAMSVTNRQSGGSPDASGAGSPSRSGTGVSAGATDVSTPAGYQPIAMRGGNASPEAQARPSGGVSTPQRYRDEDDDAQDMRYGMAGGGPAMYVRPSRSPPLSSRRIVVPPLGGHTELQSARAAQRRAEARAIEVEAVLASIAPAPARVAALTATAELVPLRAVPQQPDNGETNANTTSPRRGVSRCGAAPTGRTALHVACTTFGDRSPRNTLAGANMVSDYKQRMHGGGEGADIAGSSMRSSPPRAPQSRGGGGGGRPIRPRGRLADPTDPRATAQGREDARLMEELSDRHRASEEQQRRDNGACLPLRAAVAEAHRHRPAGSTAHQSSGMGGETLTTSTGSGLHSGGNIAAPPAETWAVPAGINYKEPFAADRSKLAVEPLASFSGPRDAPVVKDGQLMLQPSPPTSRGGGLAVAGRDTLIAVPGSAEASNSARLPSRGFQTTQHRRTAGGAMVPAGGDEHAVCFTSSTPRSTTRPVTIKRKVEVPKLRLVMTKLQ